MVRRGNKHVPNWLPMVPFKRCGAAGDDVGNPDCGDKCARPTGTW